MQKNQLESFEANPRLTIFFERLYKIKNTIKEKAENAANTETRNELQEIWNLLDALFLPNNKPMDGEL